MSIEALIMGVSGGDMYIQDVLWGTIQPSGRKHTQHLARYPGLGPEGRRGLKADGPGTCMVN